MHGFYYVYIIQSMLDEKRYYVGFSDDLKKRLHAHNSGTCKHTAKYRPWHITTVTAFREKNKAIAFEKYLKNHSGRAFAKKHF
jgi:predicted GIY-YIG superfamily endonuclease